MKQYYFILAFTFVLVSCKSETDVLIANFEEFIINASNKYNSCDDLTWKRLSNEFQKLDNRYSRLDHKLSKQEKEKIDIIKGRFYSIQVKYEARQLKNKVKRGYDKAKGFVNEFINDP